MIKGSQKQLIVLRTAESRYFDEAYFILRREIDPGRQKKGDMLVEANRILRERADFDKPDKKRFCGKWFFFAMGVLLGGALASGLFLIFI